MGCECDHQQEGLIDRPGVKVRLLALFCRICPFCIVARVWPSSAYAKNLANIERACPACRAYAKLNALSKGGSDEH